MTQNIEQRTLAATATMEGAAKAVDEIANTDKDVSTSVGTRKSFPKISREWDDESQRLQKNWGDESLRLQAEWQNNSSALRQDWQNERNELSTKALGVKPWESGVSETNINQQRRWDDGHTYLPKAVPAVMDAGGPNDDWLPFTADKNDILTDVFGRKPVNLAAGITLTPDSNHTYQKVFAFGKIWELNNDDERINVVAFSETQDGYLSITLDDDSIVIASKLDGASRAYADDRASQAASIAVESIVGDKVFPPKSGNIKVGDIIQTEYRWVRLNDTVYKLSSPATGYVSEIISDAFIIIDSSKYELINQDEREMRALGLVEGFRRHYPDDTDCFDIALQRCALIVNAESHRIYNVRGGILYSRNGQKVDLNKATIRLKDNAQDDRKNIFETDVDSSLINGVIDGNYQNNIDDISDWLQLSMVPYSHGVYTSRLQTNGDTFKKCYRSFVDNVKIKNTIRTNIVFAGVDQYHGKLTLEGSCCDHHIYFSNSENIRYKSAYISGKCRSEIVSIGTDFQTSADVGGGDLTVITNVTKSQYDAEYPAHEPCYLKFRNTGEGFSASFGIIKVKDLASDKIDDTGRVWVEPGWSVCINQYVLEKKLTLDGDVLSYTTPLEVRGSSLYISDYKPNQNGIVAKDHILSSIYAHGGASVTVDNAKLVIDNQDSSEDTIRQIISRDSDVFITSLSSEQSSGYLFRPEGIDRSSVITIGRISSAEGYTRFNYPKGVKGRDVKILHRDRLSLNGNQPLSNSNRIDPSKCEFVDLGNVGGGIFGFSRTDVYMSKITILGDGVTTLEVSDNIIYKETEEIPRLTLKNERLEFVNLFSNKWVQL